MDNPFELNAVFRLTRTGCTQNATGRINAEAFHNMPWNDGFIVTAFEGSDQHNDVEVRFVSQKPPGAAHDGICDIRLPIVMRYYDSDWIRRVDVRRPEDTFPIRSVWRITPEGAAPGRIPIRRFTANADHNWIVMGIFLDPQRHMRQTITLENVTRRENGEFMQSRYDIGMLFQWLALGWIERVDVAHIDVDTDMNCAQNKYGISLTQSKRLA